jgi:uncharacterized membrane protein YphA (DoxX/SURF4 family)
LRRLFSTFAKGLPGVGLLVLRLAAGTTLVLHEISQLTVDVPTWQTVTFVLRAGVSILLVVGLWTPLAGALTAMLELGTAFSRTSDLWTHGLVAALGIALAFLGPGGWSVDARLFGWRRIEIPERRTPVETSSDLER